MMLLTLAFVLADPSIFRAAAAQNESWLIEEAKSRRGQLSLEIKPAGRHSVVAILRNMARVRVNVLREGNSWGDARWRIVRLRSGRVDVVYETYTHGYTANVPSTERLPPGGTQKYVLDLSKEEWRASGGNAMTLEPGDTVIVTYDVPFADATSRADAWFGVVAAAATVR